MRKVYTFADLENWDEVTASEPVPIRLAVIGDPVAHSASPPMHNAALAASHIDARYCRLLIHPEEFSAALPLLAKRNFLGVNCTIPHKVAALAAVDHPDDSARRAGGVNTIAFDPDGRLHGFSTDGPGLARAVAEDFGVQLSQLRILVLGAGGGAGRAVSMECAVAPAKHLILLNRNEEKLRPLQSALAAIYPPDRLLFGRWDHDSLLHALQQSDLIINCSALGMNPLDPSPIAAGLLSKNHLVYDTIYTANRTPLNLAADAAGARSSNGFSMLLHQGALAFERWFHRPAPLEVMRNALRDRRADD